MKKILSLRYKNIDQTESFQKLQKIHPDSIDLKSLLTPDRIDKFQVQNGPITFSYATSLVTESVLRNLQELADEQAVISRYFDILGGKVMNPSEKRKVLHHMTRSDIDRGVYGEEQQKIADFAKKVHSGKIRGATGKKITDIVQIGIGGSDLGPRMVYKALKNYVQETKGKLPLKAHFVSNVDPDDANKVLNKIDVERTLFIVVSKSGTTQETLTNLNLAKERVLSAGIKAKDLSKHFIAVTGKGSPMDDPSKYLASFYIDDNIGGRYSSTSAVGGAVLSLAFGGDVFEEFLAGANEIDKASKERNILKNAALLDALLGIWERNILNYSVKAVIPYSSALKLFPAHLQQLDCESNGKTSNQYSEKVNYQTGPMVFGAPGTDGQHAFFQKLHQGTDIIPIEFIGVKEPQISVIKRSNGYVQSADVSFKGTTSQEKLVANLSAQMKALATGKSHKDFNESFSGNRSTSRLVVDQVTPRTLGALLAHFENKVMFQGFLWNLNSFDQPGVQLGKVLTDELLKKGGNKEPSLTKLNALMA